MNLAQVQLPELLKTELVDGAKTPGSVLAIMAHPDDAELWAGGTLALHAAHAPIAIATVAHSEIRNAEARAGAKVLGASLHFLEEASFDAIRRLLLEVQADVVITHHLRDVHRDHRSVARNVLHALPEVVIATRHPARVYMCDTYNSLTVDGPVAASVIVNVTSTFTKKRAALREHVSQPIKRHFGPMAENLARLWGARIGARYAEAFTPLPVLGRLPGTDFL